MAKRSKKRKAASNEIAQNVAETSTNVQWLPSWLNREWLWGLILLLAIALTYQPIWRAGFIWDDDVVVTANPCIVGPLGLKEIWTTRAADICPLTLTTFWTEHALWGLWPLPYHLVNILQHGACAVLLWRVLRSLQIPGAWLGAALWTVHPVEVESVAWITEMKNTESGLFYLLAIFFFVKGQKTKESPKSNAGDWNYALTLLFAALAMSSKSSTVILPAILCLCAWWMEGRWKWCNLAKVSPIFLMSLAASVVSIWTQNLQGAQDPQWTRSWPERLATAGEAIWFYLGKLVWPHPVMTVYPRWTIDARQWGSYLPLLAVIIALSVLWLKRHSWSRPYFFAFAYFLAALLPVLGLVDNTYFRHSFVADHFQYLAGMGPLALAGAGLARLGNFTIPGKICLQSVLAAGLLLVLGFLSWQQVCAYKNEETLWTDALARNPNCWVGYNNLGKYVDEKGQADKAIILYQKSLEINPNYVDAFNNLGNALLQKGKADEAIEQFQKALKINFNCAEAHYNLGNALLQKGKADEAIEQYQKTFEINPYEADAHYNLGVVLARKGELDKAIEQYQKALKINLGDAEIHNALGIALARKGQISEAAAQFQEAVRLKPDFSDAQNNLAKIKAMAAQKPAQK